VAGKSYDVAIVGSGFGGSLLAMVARQIGLSVLLLEKGKHPRFAIGESTSPLANLIIEDLAVRYDLPRLLPLTTYGSWQRAYADVSCGLKRGFTYFHHQEGRPFHKRPDRADQLMVGASPADEVADTHWYRADVDQFLMREAVALGADYYDEAQVSLIERPDEKGALLRIERHGEPMDVHARLVIDATGPRGFLSRAFQVPEQPFLDYPSTQTLFSHFTGVRRCDEMPAFAPPQDSGSPPYPVDDAALHHLFDGGWVWVLRFNNGITSAGVACTDDFAQRIGLTEGEHAWQRFLKMFPSLEEQFAGAEAVQPFVRSSRLTYRAAQCAGPGWAMLPSAAGFVDPLFSTGIPMTLLGIERLGRILEEDGGSGRLAARLGEYGQTTLAEIDWTAQFISACYAGMTRMPLFTAYSMFYFAAASFSEMARRIDRQHMVDQFLAPRVGRFTEGMARCGRLLREQADSLDTEEFYAAVCRYVEPANIAGLCDSPKRNWYGVDIGDVVRNAGKLGYEQAELQGIVAVVPWAQVEPPRSGTSPVSSRA
jgi:tetracycline 7-halogenase / FADH2 O2-dependent halogenase